MIDRIFAIALLLSWQAAMLSTAEVRQGLVGAVSSLVVGITLIVLLVSAADREAPPAGTDEADLFEHLAVTIPIH